MALTDKELKRRRRRAAKTCRLGEAWVKKLEKEFSVLPEGVWIGINVATGEYVVAGSDGAVSDECLRKFGEKHPCYLYWLGRQLHA